MGRPKGVKNGEGKAPHGSECIRNYSKKMQDIRMGRAPPVEYTMSIDEALRVAGLLPQP